MYAGSVRVLSLHQHESGGLVAEFGPNTTSAPRPGINKIQWLRSCATQDPRWNAILRWDPPPG
jgi:hypothetical protein